MTKSIKIILIIAGFLVLVVIKAVMEKNGLSGGLWGILLLGYLAYARAIWKYKKSSESNNELDKTS